MAQNVNKKCIDKGWIACAIYTAKLAKRELNINEIQKLIINA